MLRAISYKGVLIGQIDFIEGSWDRKWSEPGEFMVYMTLAEYNRLNTDGMKYIENIGRPELGVVMKTEYSKEESGSYVTVSGFFLEKLLDFGAYRKTQVVRASNSEGFRTELERYINNALAPVSVNGKNYKPLKGIVIDSKSVFPSSADLSIEDGEQMGNAIYQMLSGSDCGILASIDSYSNGISLRLLFKAGRELTSGETGIFFGAAYNNVDDISYTLDESGERCLYEVLQEVDAENYSAYSTSYFPIKYTEVVEGTTRYYIGCTYFYAQNAPEYMGESYPKKILNTSLSSDECDLKVTTTANQQKIKNLMLKKAQLDMLDNYKVEKIAVNIIPNKYKYGKDYDIGDRCTVLIEDLQQLYHARIEAVNETHKDNMIETQLILGTPSKQKWRRG